MLTRTDEGNLSETISTLSFGDAARNISTFDTKRKKKKRLATKQQQQQQQQDDDGDGGWVEDF